MRRIIGVIITLGTLGLAACNGGSNTQQDLATPIDQSTATAPNCCGKPGDKGNSLGVGLYCKTDTECKDAANPNFKAVTCSTIGDTDQRKTNFCTIVLCNFIDGGSPCGEGASCVCEVRGCACTPDSCVMNPPPGCMI